MSSEQYFAHRPQVGSDRRRVRLDLADLSASLVADRGVFAADHVDAGTKILLQTATPVPPEARTLVDLGCGYGPIAVTLARRAPDATVWAVDVDERARDLCTENAAANGCTNMRVVSPEEFPPDLAVDGLWSNPPIRVGKTALHDMLATWLDRLGTEARAWLVVQKHLGSDSLAGWLDDSGWSTTRLTSRQAFRVLEVCPRGLAGID